MFKDNVKIQTFKLEDLIGKIIHIQSFTNENIELITAKDLKTGELFVLNEIHHPIVSHSASLI